MKMKKEVLREMILEMEKNGISRRKIAKQLKISRNTVRRLVQSQGLSKSEVSNSAYEGYIDEVKSLYRDCKGNAVRIQEELLARYGLEIPYQSLTWLLRKWEIRKPKKKRAGVYVFDPGVEMQHDTSPHRFEIGGKKVTAQCSSLVFGYSRMLYFQYYPRFTRFECRIFLSKALDYMGGACERCIIDNTSVIVANGVGANAVMAPPMESFGKIYEFHFLAHELNDPNRKGKIERPFHYIENNFLVARKFKDWDDLNRQSLEWCNKTSNSKWKKALRMSPISTFITEKPLLKPLPVVAPPVYVSLPRVVDIEGYVTVDTNRYSVPEKYVGEKVDVLKHWASIDVYLKEKKVAHHKRCINERGKRVLNPTHHKPLYSRKVFSGPSKEETALLGCNDTLDRYVSNLKKRSHGRGTMKLRRLLEYKRTYPPEPFNEAIEQASYYGLYDLSRLESMIIKNVAGNYFELD